MTRILTRDEVRQTGNGTGAVESLARSARDWHFGMKAHIGVDAASGLVHTVVGTAGNVSDVTQAHALLHGEETGVLGDAATKGWTNGPKMSAKR